jgi:hypothetical protein
MPGGFLHVLKRRAVRQSCRDEGRTPFRACRLAFLPSPLSAVRRP